MEKEEIKTGDILVVHGSWTLAKIIQRVTNSHWNHVGIFIWIEGELFVVEAEKHGIQLTKWDGKKYNSGNASDRTVVIMSPKKKKNPKEITNFMLPFVGVRGYDFYSLIWHLILAKTNKWLGKKEYKATNRFTCSEFASYVYHNVYGFFNEWWKMSPGNVYELHKDEFNYYELNSLYN